MKKLLLLFVLLAALMLPSILHAQGCFTGSVRGIEPLANESITVSTVAIGFTSGTIQQAAGNAHIASVTVETDSIRFWVDGTNPTSSVGHEIAADAGFLVCGLNSIINFRAIRSGAGDATLRVSYFRTR
jgi:hypothetical protein